MYTHVINRDVKAIRSEMKKSPYKILLRVFLLLQFSAIFTVYFIHDIGNEYFTWAMVTKYILMALPVGFLMSFGVVGGYEAGKKLMDHVKLALLAVSLGGIETLIQHPASMTHAKLTRDAKLKAGITDELVRFSIGIEDVDDIIADLDQALSFV